MKIDRGAIDWYYDKFFTKRFSASFQGRGWEMIEPDKGINLRFVITKLLKRGCDVKCGYFTTSVRGWHRYVIFYKGGRKENPYE